MVPRVSARRSRLTSAAVAVGALLAASASGLAACASDTGQGVPAVSVAPYTSQPVAGGPILTAKGIALREITDVPPEGVAFALDPADGAAYFLNPTTGLERVDLESGAITPVTSTAQLLDGVPAGLNFGPDGTAFVVGNKATNGLTTHAVIRRGKPDRVGGFTWTTLATTVDYPLSGTPDDHLYNGVVVSPDGKYVFVNAGSRTDHGEVESNGGVYGKTRELPLTAAIFRLPADATGLVLQDEGTALKQYRYASGTRNAYSLAFAPNGQLFATDNGPDADFPDELNLIEQGKNYGFPWRFGAQPNPQAATGYDPSKDPMIEPSSSAAQRYTYLDDPGFAPPPTTKFTDALPNSGPDADEYVDANGKQQDASTNGVSVSTFTPHRSPLGLVFVPKGFGADAGKGALHAVMLSWGASIGDLPDQGQDFQAITLFKQGSSYRITTQQLAKGFKNPIGEVVVGRHVYVLEYGKGGAIWELTFS